MTPESQLSPGFVSFERLVEGDDLQSGAEDAKCMRGKPGLGLSIANHSV